MVALHSQPRPHSPAAPAAAGLSASIEDQLLEAIISGGLAFPPTPRPTPPATDSPAEPPASDSQLSTQNSALSTSPSDTSSPPHLPTSSFPAPPSTQNSALSTLARRFNISLRLLLDFLASPTTRSRIAAAIVADDLELHRRARLARIKAMDALEGLLDSSADPVERRRVASALYRGPARTPPTSAWSASIFPQSEEHDARPLRRAPEVPSPERTAAAVITTLIERLQDNDNPAPNAGLETLFNFKAADVADYARDRRRPEYLDNPGRDALLLGASSAVIHAPIEQKPEPQGHRDHYVDPKDRHAQRITFSYPDLTTHSATFHLRRTYDRTTNTPRWILDHLEHHFDAASEAEDAADTS